MKIRSVIVGVATAASLAGALEARELSLAHFMPPSHTMHESVFVPLVEEIKKETDGDLTINIYPAGELGSGPQQQYARAVEGVADLAFGLPGYTSSIFPRTIALELPGIFGNVDEAIETLWSNFDLFRQDFERTVPLAIWFNSPAIIITNNKPVRSLEDLKGMKIRAPSAIGAAALEAWGANAVTLPVTELYNALQTGVVDGIMIGADGVASFRLYEVAKFATTNLPASYTTFYLVANRDSWDSIPEETRSAVEPLLGKRLSERAATAYQQAAERALELMRGKGIEVVELSPEERQKLDSAVQPVIENYVAQLDAQGIDGQAVLSAIKN